jgi:hypothetical protein
MYAAMIRDALLRSRDTRLHAVDPKLVECWMRLTYGVLDVLEPDRFAREAREGAKLVLAFPPDTALLAKSYGIKTEQIAKALGMSVEIVEGYIAEIGAQP